MASIELPEITPAIRRRNRILGLALLGMALLGAGAMMYIIVAKSFNPFDVPPESYIKPR